MLADLEAVDWPKRERDALLRLRNRLTGESLEGFLVELAEASARRAAKERADA